MKETSNETKIVEEEEEEEEEAEVTKAAVSTYDLLSVNLLGSDERRSRRKVTVNLYG
jgi:hypothetical protein